MLQLYYLRHFIYNWNELYLHNYYLILLFLLHYLFNLFYLRMKQQLLQFMLHCLLNHLRLQKHLILNRMKFPFYSSFTWLNIIYIITILLVIIIILSLMEYDSILINDLLHLLIINMKQVYYLVITLHVDMVSSFTFILLIFKLIYH